MKEYNIAQLIQQTERGFLHLPRRKPSHAKGAAVIVIALWPQPFLFYWQTIGSQGASEGAGEDGCADSSDLFFHGFCRHFYFVFFGQQFIPL